MTRRLPLLLLLASSVVFLASLFMRWIGSAHNPITGSQTGGLLIFGGGVSYDGWGPFGSAAAILALALVAGVGWSLVRPQVETRLPLASCAFALLFFALINAGDLRARGLYQSAVNHHVTVHVGAGAWVGIACATVALLEGAALRWDEVARRPSATTVVATALTLGLLVAFLLPLLNVHVPQVEAGAAFGFSFSNLSAAVTFAAGLACFGLSLWRDGMPTGGRLCAAIGIAVLVGGNLSPLGTHHHWSYEAWLQLGCSLGLVALALVTSRAPRIALLPVADAAAVVAASLLVVSTLLPWQTVCAGGVCGSTSGWMLTATAVAGGLAVIFIVLLLGFQRYVGELSVGAVIYAMVAGYGIAQAPGRLGYGAPLGFAGAALLLVIAARRLGSVPPDRKRLLVRLVPLTACLGFLVLPVVTMMGGFVLAHEWRGYWLWLEVGAILVALRLFGRWLGGPKDDDEFVLLPVLLFALTVFDVILNRRAFGAISWVGWLSVSLCLLLAVLGWLERTSRLENLRIPEEVWRVDRLPGES